MGGRSTYLRMDRDFPKPQPLNTENLFRDIRRYHSHPDGFNRSVFFKHTLNKFLGQPNQLDIVGHIIFRLSDFLSEEERNSLKIYPSDEGTAKDELEYKWFSLRDWREEWVYLHPDGIPALTELWPESSRFLPLFQNPNR